MHGGVVVHLACLYRYHYHSSWFCVTRRRDTQIPRNSTLLLLNRDLSIQRRGQLRERDFVNT